VIRLAQALLSIAGIGALAAPIVIYAQSRTETAGSPTFEVASIRGDELAGGPKWTDSERYDIVAVPDRNAGSEQVSRDRQIRMMVRSLLADRFKLVMHLEAREMPAYILSVAKGGAKLAVTAHPPGPQLRMSRNGQMRMMTFQSSPSSWIA
jgi:uncharacterized protein (TIGR03435 family)